MAIRITTGQSSVSRTAVTGSQTTIKKVTVGTPVRIVRRVTSGDIELGSLAGIDITGVTDGALLVYNDGTQNFESKVELTNTNTTFNGGNF
jgi:hypothetical protein